LDRNQIQNNPLISIEEFAELSNRSSKTIKRHIAKMPHIHYVEFWLYLKGRIDWKSAYGQHIDWC
jgi:predicted transcriptional regulator